MKGIRFSIRQDETRNTKQSRYPSTVHFYLTVCGGI